MTRRSSLVLLNERERTGPVLCMEARLPHTASLLAMSQITILERKHMIYKTILGIHYNGSPHLLSSGPPRVARNLSLGENEMACTLTLCRVSRQ